MQSISLQYCSAWACWTHNPTYECSAASALSSTVLVLAWSLERLKMTSLRLLATLNDSQITLLPSVGYLVQSVFHILFSQLQSAQHALTLSVASCRLTNDLLMCKKWGSGRDTIKCLSRPCLRSYRWTCLGFCYLAFSLNMKQACICLCL